MLGLRGGSAAAGAGTEIKDASAKRRAAQLRRGRCRIILRRLPLGVPCGSPEDLRLHGRSGPAACSACPWSRLALQARDNGAPLRVSPSESSAAEQNGRAVAVQAAEELSTRGWATPAAVRSPRGRPKWLAA